MEILLSAFALILVIVVWNQQAQLNKLEALFKELGEYVRVVGNRPDLLTASWQKYRRKADKVSEELAERGAVLRNWEQSLEAREGG